ncbi:flippase-like domain-containing protein [Actinomadura sp. KC216]|uniref:lysylphosphatidylglycerol synthase transmembrane domain-containing protein n=1 Tax=Actinomadura sp. KC216 TaxID=2530370 RepID=UPI00105265B8|nr:lysylphosphatidylglycerol synthase transmembrane domain-containing protein [Actinomadura sp. KC216]TDB84926.1 flippase-like domain-containing protein [Actinomadura sp. KC216]
METIAAGAERAAPAELPGPRERAGGGAAATPSLVRRVRGSRWTVLGILLIAAALTALLTGAVPHPSGLADAVSAPAQMRWEFLPALVLLSVLHYVCSAVALRGASGRPIPLYETTLTQFTAAAANRVTPGGLGAVAVNTRYLVCQGLPLSRAAIAVAVLQVAGVPADLLLLGAVLGLGGGDGRVMDALGHHAAQAAGLVPPVPLLIAVGVLLPAAALWGRRAARSAAVGRAVAGFADLCRRPRDLAVTLAASAATTLVLGLAFALSVLAVPGTGAGPGDALALVAAYLVGAAAGSAVPSPGGVGSTEAALVAALASLGIAAGPALQAVLLFRAITFWAPVPVGLLTCRTLRR